LWHFAAENGEQDFAIQISLSSASFFGKTGFTAAAIFAGFCGVLPRDLTSDKEDNQAFILGKGESMKCHRWLF
jgi:hypothetical protein